MLHECNTIFLYFIYPINWPSNLPCRQISPNSITNSVVILETTRTLFRFAKPNFRPNVVLFSLILSQWVLLIAVLSHTLTELRLCLTVETLIPNLASPLSLVYSKRSYWMKWGMKQCHSIIKIFIKISSP